MTGFSFGSFAAPRAIEPLLSELADDEIRFAGVTRLVVNERGWHHVATKPVGTGARGPRKLTGMVDLTP